MRMGSKPILEYMWIKVLEDGKTIIPQFDFETGKQNSWNADNVKLSKVKLVPFTNDLANKMIKHGSLAIANTAQSVEMNVNGEDVVAGIDAEISVTDYYVCDICGWKFKYVKVANEPFVKCPQCGTSDDWYCSRCGEYKYDYRITKKNQVQCLDCDIPIGLDRTRHLHVEKEVRHICDYFIRTPTRSVTIYSDGNISIT